jgi:hypothetical protein
MAPTPDNPGVCKVALVFNRDTRTFINTFHVDAEVGEWDITQMIVLAENFRDWWNTHYRQAVSDKVSLVQVQVRKYDPAVPLAYDLPVSPPLPGGRPGTVSPGNVTSTVSWRTGLAGRRFRGRIYNPGISEADTSEADELGSVVINLLAQAALQLITGALTTGELGVFHAPKDTPSAFDNTITEVVSAVVEDILDSQRRRLPGRGR